MGRRDGAVDGDSSRPWQTLASGFEQARAREDSLDRLVDWPAQRAFVGDVTGLAVLDAGCGNGAKIAQLAADGAAASVGVDISGNFIAPPPGVELITGDLSDLVAVPGIAGRRFDRILFLQSFGYAADGVRALRIARELLTKATAEPQMPVEAAERYPHKQAVMNKYLGILMFKLRPLPGQ